MHLRICVVLTLAIFAGMAPQLARVASAQPAAVYHDGMAHSALGAATVTVNALSRRLSVDNIGSSGQDGVEVKWPKGSLGCSVSWPDYDTEFAMPGCTHTMVLRGTSAGASVVAAKLTVVRNSDGSENFLSDFSGVHGNSWVALIDASGATSHLTCCKPTYDVKANKRLEPYLASRRSDAPPSTAVWATLRSPSSTEQSIEVVYPVLMTVTVDGFTADCRGIRFYRNAGDAVGAIGPFGIKSAFPASGGSGTFTIETEMTDPPCAGLNCPNGPGTSLRALGGALWLSDGTASVMQIFNIGSSGQDGCRESPSRPSLGQTRPPVKAISLSIADPSPASTLTPGTMVWKGEGRSGVNPLYENQCTLTCSLSGGQTHCVPDFSACGASGYRVMLSRNGAVVADVANPLDGFTVTTSMPDFEMQLARTAAGGPRIIRNCRTPPCPGEPVLMAGAVYVADHIEIEGIDATGSSIPPIADFSALEMRASGMAPITIIGGNADPVTPVTAVDGAPGTTIAEFGRPVLSPNPTLGPVRVRFALSLAGHTRVTVSDIMGRALRTLADSDLAAGTHDFSWDGRNDQGFKTPAGLYFIRVDTAISSRVTRLTRLW